MANRFDKAQLQKKIMFYEAALARLKKSNKVHKSEIASNEKDIKKAEETLKILRQKK